MKQKIIQHIESLIQEHEDNFCCDWEQITEADDYEAMINRAYDVGRYDTLLEIKSVIERGE